MKKIYLVDDDEDDRMLTRDALESVMEDTQIIELEDGRQLLDLMDQQPTETPDVILMDLNMPRMTGHEALSSLRKRPDCQHVPVILYSTSRQPDAVKKSYQLGANAYIVKPSAMDDYQRMAHAVNLCFLNVYTPITPSLSAGCIGGKSVVIIEDNADQGALMELSLRQAAPGLTVVRHSTAEAAMDFLKAAPATPQPAVDLIILDLYLPSRQMGLDLLARIQDHFATRHAQAVPIVIFSASDRKEDMQASYRQQANAYLVKTVELTKSASHLRDLCYFWWNTITPPRKAG